MNDIKRPKQKVKREIKRSNIALDDYMFDRKMQSLYYGAKPKSDDLPTLFKFIRRVYRRGKREIGLLPQTVQRWAKNFLLIIKKYPARFLTAVLVLSLLVIFIVPHLNNAKESSSPAAAQPLGNDKTSPVAPTSRIPLNQNPEFPVILPQGTKAEDFGGWAKVSPPNSPATYAYKDKIGAVNVLVSEQQLPDVFKIGTSAQVQKMAIGFNATQSVKTEKVEFFVGSNSDGEQSVITYTKTLLIFLKSSAKVSNERWQSYIEDLK